MTATESPPAAEPFERLSREPLYQKVHQAILERLKNGVWQPGTKLPAETDLAREFGVAVGTVRKAVTWLVTDGVLERRPGRGTFVATIRNSGYRNNFQPFTSVDGKARFTERELIDFERRAATDEVAAALGLKPGDPVIHFVRLLTKTGEGKRGFVSTDESFLPAALFPHFTKAWYLARFRPSDSLYKFYDREFGIVITKQTCTLRLVTPETELAKRFRIPEGLAVIESRRISKIFGSTPVEFRINRMNPENLVVRFDLP